MEKCNSLIMSLHIKKILIENEKKICSVNQMEISHENNRQTTTEM